MMPATAVKPVDDLVGLTVQEIEKKRGVGRRYAYELYVRANRPPEVTVRDSQKLDILAALEDEMAPDVTTLSAWVLSKGGAFLDAHAMTHVLWSMQKQRLVRFRERKNGPSTNGSTLTAIKMTPTGYDKLLELRERAQARTHQVEAPMIEEPVSERPGDWSVEEAEAEQNRPPITITAVDEATPVLSEAIAAVEAIQPLTSILTGFPRLVALIERADRAHLVREAVALLERAGEDTTAIELLERHVLSDDEDEMVRFLRSLGPR